MKENAKILLICVSISSLVALASFPPEALADTITATIKIGVCGDGVIDTAEQCDGSALGGVACSSQGFSGGSLNCSSACEFDTASCLAGSSNGSSGGGGFIPGASLPPQIVVRDAPLVIAPEQSGILSQDTAAGKIILEVPADSVLDKAVFTITSEPLIQSSEYLVLDNAKLVNGAFYDISVRDQNGNYLHSFLKPITITLPIPIGLVNVKNFAVYYLDETNWQWVLIPDAIFAAGKVTFQVNHLTRFAIFSMTKVFLKIPNANGGSQKILQKLPSSLPLDNQPVIQSTSTPLQPANHSTRNRVLGALIILLIAPLILFRHKK